ncbi:MAG: PKD domain-containing protein, partial [Candidatus Bathyarchaeia archaeon]
MRKKLLTSLLIASFLVLLFVSMFAVFVKADGGPLTVSVPSSATVDVGQSASFTATVSGGTGPYTYQWFLNDALDSTQTGSSYVYNATTEDVFALSVTVTDSASNVVSSNTETITVDSALSISVDLSSVTIDSGQSATLSSTVTGGTGSYLWQWYDDSNP